MVPQRSGASYRARNQCFRRSKGSEWSGAGSNRRPSAFQGSYANPVLVNGTEMTVTEMVGRARSLQQAFTGLSMDILDAVETRWL